jgi:DNA-directed RNA polymerase subunit D
MKLKTDKEGYVYSGNMKGDFEVIYDKMPITLLNKNQEFEIKATVKAGKGVEHAKFSPGIMFYRNLFDVKVDKDCPEEVIKLCPKKVFVLDKNKVVAENPERCDMCEVCTDYCRKHKNESIKITSNSELVVTIESFGQITPKEMFEKSIDALKKDLNEVAKKLK